jgi:hypothetical protein
MFLSTIFADGFLTLTPHSEISQFLANNFRASVDYVSKLQNHPQT